jgi:hypothetical protein
MRRSVALVAVAGVLVLSVPAGARAECAAHDVTASRDGADAVLPGNTEKARELVVTLPSNYGDGKETSVLITGASSQSVVVTAPANVSATAVGGAGAPGGSGAAGTPAR